MTKLANIFFLLGSISEYQGRVITADDNHIEYFYSNERIAAKIFNDKAIELLNLSNIKEPIKITVGSGGQIHLENKAVTDILNSYYPSGSSQSEAVGSDGKFHPSRYSMLTEQTIAKSNKEEKYAFLLGAYIRYGKEQCLNFANNLSKAKIIEKLLSEFEYTNVVLEETTCKDCEPSSFKVCFTPKSNNDHLAQDANDFIKRANSSLNKEQSWGLK